MIVHTKIIKKRFYPLCENKLCNVNPPEPRERCYRCFIKKYFGYHSCSVTGKVKHPLIFAREKEL